ncbi:MAG: recombinase family protein [Candidatus Colwellbacteria bacterium]|nr:recombinase family protein [Candidatus Colwellbacteria bacterium]
MQQKFFLYVRKSTDVDDKQALSIEAQLTELKAFAQKENITIADVIVEKKTAKIPGRLLFNDMLNRIEAGEDIGILSWHPDRLARNSVDGGRIIYLLDTGKITTLKFPQFWYENTAQGKFMLNMAFGQSKYYVDSLSENTKRGLRQKVRNGICPTVAPLGYLNDVRTKTVVVNKKRSVMVRQAFELYAEGNSRLEDISHFLAQNGVLTRGGRHSLGIPCPGNKPWKADQIKFMLSNPYYYGHFRYGGELHEGKQQPIISKALFDRVQTILQERSHPHHHEKNDPRALCGLLSCQSCGMMITAEKRVKRQKNGNEHHYVYYHCTKKNKAIKCTEPCIREEEL